MAINHTDHGHPNTPAARTACRKLYAANDMVNELPHVTAGKATQMTVVPRKRGDGGVVKGMKAAVPKNVKRPNGLIKNTSDLADVPRMLAYAVRLAWAEDWDVRVGDRFNEAEARITIQGDKGEISLIWKVTRPEGLWKIWVRNFDSSKQFVIESAQEAIQVMRHDSNRWDEYGNLT